MVGKFLTITFPNHISLKKEGGGKQKLKISRELAANVIPITI